MKQFERIMERALEQAERVKCSREDYEKGLVAMFRVLKERLEMEEIDPEQMDLEDEEEETPTNDDVDFDEP